MKPSARNAVPTIQPETWRALMASAQHGDQAAYDRLLHELEPLLLRLARRRWRNSAADAEDLVQDVLMSLHETRMDYDPDRPFMPWLMGIFSHRLADIARHNAGHATRELPMDRLDSLTEAAAPMPDGQIDYPVLRKALAGLPPHQRLAVELLRIRELSAEHAAAMTGINAATLRVSAHRAVKKLRDRMSP